MDRAEKRVAELEAERDDWDVTQERAKLADAKEAHLETLLLLAETQSLAYERPKALKVRGRRPF